MNLNECDDADVHGRDGDEKGGPRKGGVKGRAVDRVVQWVADDRDDGLDGAQDSRQLTCCG